MNYWWVLLVNIGFSPRLKVTNNQLVTFYYEPIMNNHDGFRYITYHISSIFSCQKYFKKI
jgi:hypothetical protein